MTLPTTPLDADKVKEGHLIPVHGLTARIHRIVPPEFTSDLCHHFHWVIIDPVPAEVKDLGVLRVPFGETVECVRYSDWLAARNARSAAEKAAAGGGAS